MVSPLKRDPFRLAREVVQASEALHTAIRIAIAHEISRDTFVEMVQHVWSGELAELEDDHGKHS